MEGIETKTSGAIGQRKNWLLVSEPGFLKVLGDLGTTFKFIPKASPLPPAPPVISQLLNCMTGRICRTGRIGRPAAALQNGM